MMRLWKIGLVIAVFLFATSYVLRYQSTERRSRVSGPIEATVVRVVDGDTLEVEAYPWPHLIQKTLIRINGIDCPESGAKASCPSEADRAAAVAAYNRNLLLGRIVRLEDVRFDKYGGRMLAEVQTVDGVSWAERLIQEGHARPYTGRGPRSSWCMP